MRLLRNALMLAAVLLLGYCGFVLTGTWIYQTRQAARFAAMLHAPVSSAGLPLADAGGVIGRIEGPRVGLSVVIMEGAGESVMRHAAGHISGTALPGQPGNVGISAHR